MPQSQRLYPHHHTKHSSDYDITDAIRVEKFGFGILTLRISIGGLMLIHGVNKIFSGNQNVSKVLETVGLPTFFSFGVILAEVVAPLMLIIGFKVRLAAFLVAFDMLMAILLVHSKELFKLTEMGGWKIELNALYFFGAIALIFFGSGKFAISKGKGYLD